MREVRQDVSRGALLEALVTAGKRWARVVREWDADKNPMPLAPKCAARACDPSHRDSNGLTLAPNEWDHAEGHLLAAIDVIDEPYVQVRNGPPDSMLTPDVDRCGCRVVIWTMPTEHPDAVSVYRLGGISFWPKIDYCDAHAAAPPATGGTLTTRRSPMSSEDREFAYRHFCCKRPNDCKYGGIGPCEWYREPMLTAPPPGPLERDELRGCDAVITKNRTPPR
jgi:hypothetical protein